MSDSDKYWTPKDYNLFVGASGESRDEVIRKLNIAWLVKRFSRTGDMETLAQLAELDPPGGNALVGSAIAKAVRPIKNEKIERDQRNFEIDRLFRWMTEHGATNVEAYTKIAEIYFPDEERGDTKSVDVIRRTRERWLKQMKAKNKKRLDKEIEELKKQSERSNHKSL